MCFIVVSRKPSENRAVETRMYPVTPGHPIFLIRSYVLTSIFGYRTYQWTNPQIDIAPHDLVPSHSHEGKKASRRVA